MHARVYAGTFTLAAAILALEVTLTRLLSVMLWYHLSFFAVAVALLGMTAGATTVFLEGPKPPEPRIARACLQFAIATPLCLGGLLYFPSKSVLTLALVDALLAFVPFYFGGVAISAVLTKLTLPIGRLYAADLLGAATGSLVVLGGLELLDAPNLVLVIAALGALSAALFSSRAGYAVAALLTVAAVSPLKLRPVSVKGAPIAASDVWYERWNSFSRVVVYPPVERPAQLWGPSPNAPRPSIVQHLMNIDGEAATTVRRGTDVEHLKLDVTNAAYALGRTGPALVIGVGGGRDVQSALLFGHTDVTGIELNPIFIDLLNGPLADFAGLAKRPGVTLTVDEGRGWVARSPRRFAVIQMSLIDTWAATGAGAFTLSENGLYTVEAWRLFIDHLADDGLFTVSRWYDEKDLGETGRLVSLALAALFEAGVAEPKRHVALVSSGSVTTLVLSRRPFEDAELRKLAELDFQYGTEHPVLTALLAARSRAELDTIAARQPLDFSAPTDERPYFFNMLRLSNLDGAKQGQGVVGGNLVATLVLLTLMGALAFVALLTVLLPLKLAKGAARLRDVWAGALYFSLIGAGFMFVEIALIQRLSVYLSHPVYALGVLLFSIICSTGVGALMSERWAPGVRALGLAAAAAILAERWLLPAVIGATIAAPMTAKAAISVGVLFPLGVLLGFFFPTGMRLARAAYSGETPWFWALNGVFSVLVSAVAVFVSIYWGISTNFWLAAGCYALTLVAGYGLTRAGAVGTRVSGAG